MLMEKVAYHFAPCAIPPGYDNAYEVQLGDAPLGRVATRTVPGGRSPRRPGRPGLAGRIHWEAYAADGRRVGRRYPTREVAAAALHRAAA